MCTFTLRYCLKERKRATTIAVAIVGRAITIQETIQKRSHEPIYKTYTKIKAKGLRATTIAKLEATERSPILLSQYWINEDFELIQ